jgi:flagellar biosynthesis/type III secretory pathway protein FliH
MSSSEARAARSDLRVGRLLRGSPPTGRPAARQVPPPQLPSVPDGSGPDPAPANPGRAGSAAPGSGRVEMEDLVRLRRAAERRGYAEGLARGRKELEAAVAAAGTLAAELERLAPSEVRRLARTIVTLGVEVARQILAAELRTDPELLVRAVEEAVREMNGSPTARVLLHPDVVAPVRAAWEAAHGSAYLGKRWVFEADGSLPPAGCRVQFDHGFVDASPEAQVAEVAAALERALPAAVEATVEVVVGAGRGDSIPGSRRDPAPDPVRRPPVSQAPASAPSVGERPRGVVDATMARGR